MIHLTVSLFIATLTDDNMKKMEVYNTAASVNSKDYRTFNNLAVTQYKVGDYAGAKANWEHALRLNPQAKEPAMNLGLISMLNNDYNRANELIGSAAGVPESADALGVYYLTQGDLQKAVVSFGDSKTNNAALARILLKDYASARDILKDVKNPDATTYYLQAIMAARTGDQNGALSNLRQSINLDKSMEARARQDLEFANVNLSYL